MAHDGRPATATRLPGAATRSWWVRAFSDGEDDESPAGPPRRHPAAYRTRPPRPPAGPPDPGPRRLFTPEGLRELVPDVAQRDVYLYGPPGLVDSAVEPLRRLRLPRRQLHLDPFEF